MECRILGAEQVRARLEQMEKAVKSANGKSVIVGSSAEYAVGIAYGRFPGGRLARKLGGDFALDDALEIVKGSAQGLANTYLASGRSVMDILWALGNQVLAHTRVYLTERVYSIPIPTTRKGKDRWKRTGYLRESYTVAQGGSGSLRSLYGGR